VETTRTFAGVALGLGLLGCGPGASPEQISDGQQGTPRPGSYADAVPANLPRLTGGDVDLAAGARASNAFGLDLHKRLASHGKNLIWSPYSVSSVLGMGLAGARGTTADEMRKVLHVADGDAEAIAQALGVHQRLLHQRAGADNTLRVATAIWGAPDARFLPEYILSIGAAYGGGFNRIDFAADPEKARSVINDWVGKNTDGLIPKLIPAHALTPTTKAVLCNALYFKGTWQHQFKTSNTAPRTFALEAGGTAKPATMSRRGKLRLRDMDRARVAAFPYEGGALSMVVILPDDVNGLRDLEKSLTDKELSEWIDEVLGSRLLEKVDITLPKWKARVASNLVPQLKALGLQACFDDTADFSGMVSNFELYVSHVLHEAFVEVNEEGTEAAAATAMVMKARGGPPKSLEFYANHPFLYAIVDHETQAILFLGRCADPSKK
jgi:serpin B